MKVDLLRRILHWDFNSRSGASGDIRRFQIFESLTPSEAAIIERMVYRRQFKPGECIVNEGDAAVGLYLINSGEVTVFKSVKNKLIELATLSEGSFFGELTLLKERKRTATVIAVERTDVLCLFRPDFLHILDNHPSICSKFLHQFCETILERINHMYGEINKL